MKRLHVPKFTISVGVPFCSDSSYECTSQDAASVNGVENGIDRTDMKPFEMDFDVKSNRSSLVSQVSH